MTITIAAQIVLSQRFKIHLRRPDHARSSSASQNLRHHREEEMDCGYPVCSYIRTTRRFNLRRRLVCLGPKLILSPHYAYELKH